MKYLKYLSLVVVLGLIISLPFSIFLDGYWEGVVVALCGFSAGAIVNEYMRAET